MKNLELRDYLGLPSDEDIAAMSVVELKEMLKVHSVPIVGALEKSELVEMVKSEVISKIVTKYDLVANICHDSPPGQKKESQISPLEAGSYRAHIQNKATEQWYEIQDLHVQETMPQLVGLSESYLLVYERKSSATATAAAQALVDDD